MSTMNRRRFTQEFKDQAVELVRLGQTIRDVAEQLGIGKSNLHRWVLAADHKDQAAQGGGAVEGAAGNLHEADELRRLKREVDRLKLENDILKKAAVILGTKRPRNDEK